jgi:hypothetical protein
LRQPQPFGWSLVLLVYYIIKDVLQEHSVSYKILHVVASSSPTNMGVDDRTHAVLKDLESRGSVTLISSGNAAQRIFICRHDHCSLQES